MLRFALAGASLAVGLGAQQGPQVVEVGSKPTYSFQQALVNGRGISSLADLKGKPTMIEFWGTR